jgi:hypothetical protein
MAVLVTARNAAWNDGYTGYVYRRVLDRTDNSWLLSSVPIPSGVSTLPVAPSFATHDRRTYIAGMFSALLVFAEDEQLYKAGIEGPLVAPTVVAGTGTIVDACQCYISFVQKIGTLDVAESNLSPATALTLATQGRTWTPPTATLIDPHVTHIRGYVSANGDLPRRVFEVTVGAGAFTEDVQTSTLALHPAYYNNGVDPVDDNGVPPYCKYAVVFNKRLFLAGDPQHPYRLWYSELNRPTAFGVDSRLDTRGREPITGLAAHGSDLIVFCNRATYVLQGWTDGSEGIAPDMRLDPLFPGLGCISHWSIKEINKRLWYAAEDGIRVYDGGFSYMMKDLRTYWKDNYAANVSAYRQAVAVDDKTNHCYILLIPRTSGGAFHYVANYLDTDPAVGGSGLQPAWSVDTKARTEYTIGSLIDEDGVQRWYSGGSDGYVRQNDIPTDADDDGDTDAKLIDIVTKHYIYGQPGLTVDEGKSLTRFFTQIESESQAHTVSVYAGGEAAGDQLNPSWTQSPAAQALTYDPGDGTSRVAIAESRFAFVPSDCSGEGFTFRFQATSPTDFKFRGFGGEYGPGKCARGFSALA